MKCHFYFSFQEFMNRIASWEVLKTPNSLRFPLVSE
jgi:hypothetical protein